MGRKMSFTRASAVKTPVEDDAALPLAPYDYRNDEWRSYRSFDKTPGADEVECHACEGFGYNGPFDGWCSTCRGAAKLKASGGPLYRMPESPGPFDNGHDD